MADEMTVVWHGGMRDVYLCVRLPEIKLESLTPRSCAPKVDRSAETAAVLQLLGQRERWRVRDLRCSLGLDLIVMAVIMQRLRRHRLIRSVGHGTISLRRWSEAA